MTGINVLSQQLLDQNWAQAEEFMESFDMLSGGQIVAVIMSDPRMATLAMKACAMVAEQCRANIRARKEQRPVEYWVTETGPSLLRRVMLGPLETLPQAQDSQQWILTNARRYDRAIKSVEVIEARIVSEEAR